MLAFHSSLLAVQFSLLVSPDAHGPGHFCMCTGTAKQTASQPDLPAQIMTHFSKSGVHLNRCVPVNSCCDMHRSNAHRHPQTSKLVAHMLKVTERGLCAAARSHGPGHVGQ